MMTSTNSRLLQLANCAEVETVQESGSHVDLDKINPKLKQLYVKFNRHTNIYILY